MHSSLLVEAIQRLARSRRLDDVTTVIRETARRLIGADGVTFVLRDQDQCHYVDEDAIGPLWKGNRYPLKSCITGWVMLNKRATVVPDIFADDRIPHAAYRPTFVKSLAAAPIRSDDPIGAIGAYWARIHRATDEEVATLQALADASATALENVRLLNELRAAHDAALRQTAEIRSLFERSQDELAQRKIIERALRKSEERLLVALEAGKMGTWEWDLSSGKHRWTGGYNPFEPGSSRSSGAEALAERVHPGDRAGLEDAADRARMGTGVFEHEFRLTAPERETRWVRATGRLLLSTDDGPKITGVIQDITEHRRLMTELVRAQKMESIGRLAGGVAHDFNNALTAIIGSVELAGMPGVAPDLVRDSLKTIGEAAAHATSLTRQLLAFARKQVLEPRVVNLNDLVASTQAMVTRLLPAGIEVRTDLAPDLWRVKVDPEQVVQVLVNLAVNARDAMPAGGRLTFGSGNVEIGPDGAVQLPEVNEGRYAMLSVADTGVGMDQTVQKFIFEPFFTTKGQGHGTGLGLATVHGIVKQHGGHVWVYSEPGRGTIFKIFFPETTESAAAPAREPAPALRPGAGTVLLVEDEPLVRQVAGHALRAAGYTVLEAGDGEAALEAARGTKGQLDVLVTDIVLPGMSGLEIAEKLSALYPGLRVICTSGYSEEAALGGRARGNHLAFLPKPYSLAALTNAVRQILHGGGDGQNALRKAAG